jgi:hypothetical protein
MTESVIVAARRELDLDWLTDKLQPKFAVQRNKPFDPKLPWSLLIEDGRSHVFIDDDPEIVREFEADDLRRLTSLLPSDPIFYNLTFVGLDLLKRVLLTFISENGIVVDNTCGIVEPGPEFAKRLLDKPEWDWITEAWQRKQDV